MYSRTLAHPLKTCHTECTIQNSNASRCLG